MHVKLPAWVIPVQWEKWNYTFKECQRRFNFDRNRNKPLLLAVVSDFEVLKFWKWIWIQSMELDKLQGNPWVVKISRGHFFVLIKTRWDCFCNLQKGAFWLFKFFLKVRLQGPVKSVSLWGCVILAESDEIALFNQKRLFLACAYIKITFCSKE